MSRKTKQRIALILLHSRQRGIKQLKRARNGMHPQRIGNARLKRSSEHSKRCSKVGKELESIKLVREELTRICTNCKTPWLGH